MHRVRSLLVLALVSTLIALGLVAASPNVALGNPAPQLAPTCSAFDDPIYQVVKGSGLSLLTPWKAEASSALANYGFDSNDGEVFKASTSPGPGLVEVHRLYRPWPAQDFLATADVAEIEKAKSSLLGYQDQGTRFYASQVPADCLSPVYRYVKGTKHRLSGSQRQRAALVADGWKAEDVAFSAAVTEPVAAPAPVPVPVPMPTPTTRTPTPTASPTPTSAPTDAGKPAPTPSPAPQPTATATQLPTPTPT